MRSNPLSKIRVAGLFLILPTFAASALAQSAAEPKVVEEAAGGGWWFLVTLGVVIALGAAVLFWRKSRKGPDQPQSNYNSRYADHYGNPSYDIEGVDADKELEWLRKAKKNTAPKADKLTLGLTTPGLVTAKPASGTPRKQTEDDFQTKAFQERMRKLQYAQLPINSFGDLSPAKLYEPLPLSNDPSVINAIDQAHEEFEEDESVRELALRILTAFRTRNSVEALSQIALYDLSSGLRSKAISTLTDFDHQSVFETILLGCADPTREVRAAAARGLFRLSFDRADAWKRIIETNDEFRMSHAARAAIESGIVVKSFDRLIHEDLKVAYEAFALITLIIRAGETELIFKAINTHKDERVKFALLHLLKLQRDTRTLGSLQELKRNGDFTADVAVRIREAIESSEQVMA